MSVEDDLHRLALKREDAFESALNALDLDPPDRLLRYVRAYLADQEDHRNIGHFEEKSVHLSAQANGIQELDCRSVEFVSGSKLDFKVRMKKQQTGWRITQFMFHVRLPHARKISMIRIHLNVARTRDPLAVPRCHVHIGGGKRAHVPFPIMSPRLTLHLICNEIEPDVGT